MTPRQLIKELEKELEGHHQALNLLKKLKDELPIKENERGIPSLWYMPLVSTEGFFDGFGFNDKKHADKFKWQMGSVLDERELRCPPKRPLLQYLETIVSGHFPKKWDHRSKELIPNDEWLIMDQALGTSID